MPVFEYAKRLFFILIFLHFARPLFESLYEHYSYYIVPSTKVAIVPIDGLITQASPITKHIRRFFKDNSIKAILIKIDCSGSASGTGQIIHNEIKALKQQFPSKPIVTVIENMCTSGGYYIASATDAIIAPGMAIVGNIGVTLPFFFQLGEFIKYHHIGYEQISAGTYKSIGDPFVDIRPQERELLQSVLDDSYDQFTHDVARNRNIPIAQKNVWADGKVFSGRQALKLGLIDSLGSFSTAEHIIKEKALIEGEITWIKTPKSSGLQALFEGGFSEAQLKSALTVGLNYVQRTLFTQDDASGRCPA